ncbi:MAG: hypothetical protein V9G19_17585 [Tetrasphaera sp.]
MTLADRPPRRLVHKLALVGAGLGLFLAVALTFGPDLANGYPPYEWENRLVVFTGMLVPLGAASGALIGAPVDAARAPSRWRLWITLAVWFVILLAVWVFWTWATTGAWPLLG